MDRVVSLPLLLPNLTEGILLFCAAIGLDREFCRWKHQAWCQETREAVIVDLQPASRFQESHGFLGLNLYLIKWGVLVELNIQFLRLASFLVSPDLPGNSKGTSIMPVIWKDLGVEDDSWGEWDVFAKHGLTSDRRLQLAAAGLQTENDYNWTDQRRTTLELCSRRRVLGWLTLVWERKMA